MEIEGVKDRLSLKHFLKRLPDDRRGLTARRVAFLAAFRVAPIGLRYAAKRPILNQREFTAMPQFESLGYAGIASTFPILDYGTPATLEAPAFSSLISQISDASARSSLNAANSSSHTAAFGSSTELSISAGAASSAAKAVIDLTDLWSWVRHDLRRLVADPFQRVLLVWEGVQEPPEIATAWLEAKAILLKDNLADWRFWVTWFERVQSGHDIKAAALTEVLRTLTREELEGDPAAVMGRFDPILALYENDGLGAAGTTNETRATLHIKTVRVQVSALQEFLETEYRELSGQNARSPTQDDLLEVLKDLKALVDQMIERLDASGNEPNALVAVQEDLPAVIEQTNVLALIETEPKVSTTVATMALTIKTLVESGADPKLTTQFAISEAASRKIFPRIRRFFGRKD